MEWVLLEQQKELKKLVDTVAEGTKDTVTVAQKVTDKGLDTVAEGGEEIKKRAESPIERQLDEEENKEAAAEDIDPNSAFASSLKKQSKEVIVI